MLVWYDKILSYRAEQRRTQASVALMDCRSSLGLQTAEGGAERVHIVLVRRLSMRASVLSSLNHQPSAGSCLKNRVRPIVKRDWCLGHREDRYGVLDTAVTFPEDSLDL